MIATILIDIALVVYVLASLGLLIYGLNAYAMIALQRRSRDRVRREEQILRRDHDLAPLGDRVPLVTTQLPIYNEHNVVERLLGAVCAMEYPAGRHEIQVLDDSTDETSALVAELVAKLRARGHDIHHLRRQDRRGFKAGALAEGLKVARGELVAIFDADFVPPVDFLHNTVPFLLADPRCCFVQTRWGHRNRRYSLLTELQSIGIDGHFVVEQAARAWNGLFFNFNGTAGVWRRAAIDDAGGWTADTLTEDLDLSYRAILGGWRPRYLCDMVTPAEVPTDINALKSQQRRWATGSIQCAMKLLPVVLRRPDLGRFRKFQAVLHLTHYLIHPLILTMTLLVLPLVQVLRLEFGGAFTAPLVAVMLIALFGPSTLYLVSQAATGESWRRAVMLMPILIALGIGLAVNNSVAVGRALLGLKGGEFVRTPKLGARAEAASGAAGRAKLYRPPPSRLFMLELLVGAWAMAAFVSFLAVAGPGGGAFLLLQAVGFSVVGVLSALHHLRGSRTDPVDQLR